MKPSRVVIFFLFCIIPGIAVADLSSTNYTVTGQAISGSSQSGNATSTNYDADQESGGLYTYYASPTTTNTSPSNTGTQTVTPPPTTPPVTTLPPTTPPVTQPPTTNPAPATTNTSGSSGGSGGSSSGTRVSTSTEPIVPNNSDTATTPTPSDTPSDDTTPPPTTSQAVNPVEQVTEVLQAFESKIAEFKQTESHTKTIDVTGVGIASALSWLSLTQSPFALSHLGRIFTQGWANLLGLFALRRKRRPWGTVYDSQTKVPLDPAYVEIFDTDGKKQGDAITDLDGRYGFLVPEGSYTIKVKKTNYAFPSKHLHVTGEDTIYRNLYFGGYVPMSEAAAFDIPMDPLKFDWNQYEKLRIKKTYFFHRLDPIMAHLMRFLFYASVAAIVWQYYSIRDAYSLGLLIVYLILLVILQLRGKPPLFGTLEKDGLVLPFAIIRVLSGKTTIQKKVTDKHGRYIALVPNGSYTIEIQTRFGESDYRTIATKPVVIKNGVINENIKI